MSHNIALGLAALIAILPLTVNAAEPTASVGAPPPAAALKPDDVKQPPAGVLVFSAKDKSACPEGTKQEGGAPEGAIWCANTLEPPKPPPKPPTLAPVKPAAPAIPKEAASATPPHHSSAKGAPDEQSPPVDGSKAQPSTQTPAQEKVN